MNKPINITSTSFPIVANYIFDNIGSKNAEDIIWENLIDTVSEIEENEIGVGLTQSYQYTKLNNATTILTKWQGIKTANGPEFRIGLGLEPGRSGAAPAGMRSASGSARRR